MVGSTSVSSASGGRQSRLKRSVSSSARTPFRPEAGITSASRIGPPSSPPVPAVAAATSGIWAGTVEPSATSRKRERCSSTFVTNVGEAASTERLRRVSLSPVEPSTTTRLNRVPGSTVSWSTATVRPAPQAPGLDASSSSGPAGPPRLHVVGDACVATPRVTRTTTASRPSFWKYCATAKLMRLSCQRPPKMRS